MTTVTFKGKEYDKATVAALAEADLLALYNALAEELGHRPYAKFSSIEAGQKRVWGALIGIDAALRTKAAPNVPTPATKGKKSAKAAAESTTKEKTDMTKTTKAKKSNARRTAAPKAKAAGRTHNRTAGLKLYPGAKENPGREGTDAFKSFNIILGKPGITTEDYLKKGGARKFLTRSIRGGLVTTKGAGK